MLMDRHLTGWINEININPANLSLLILFNTFAFANS